MKCKNAEDYIVQLIYDELEPDVAKDVLAHMADCDACSDKYVDLKEGTLALEECFSNLNKQAMTDAEMAAILDVESSTPVGESNTQSQKSKVLPFFFGRSWGMAATAMLFCGILTLFLISRAFMGLQTKEEAKTVAERASNHAELEEHAPAYRRDRDYRSEEKSADYKPSTSKERWDRSLDIVSSDGQVGSGGANNLPNSKVYGSPSANNAPKDATASNYTYFAKGLNDSESSDKSKIGDDRLKRPNVKGTIVNGTIVMDHTGKLDNTTFTIQDTDDNSPNETVLPGEIKKAQVTVFDERKKWKRAREEHESTLLRDPTNEKAISGLEDTYKELRDSAQKRRKAEEKERMAEIEWKWIDPVGGKKELDKSTDGKKDLRVELEEKNRELRGLPVDGAEAQGPEKPKKNAPKIVTPKPVTDEIAADDEDSVQTDPNRDSVFKQVPVNPFVMTSQDQLSTFALDTDTASYTIARNYVSQGYLPPVGSVRTEEYVNAFDYNYPGNVGNVFTVNAEAAPSPFGKGLVLVKIGVRGKVIGRDGRKASHLVFAVDTSGSMARRDRLPLLKKGLSALLDKLNPNDRISLVTYGRESRLILDNELAQNTDALKKAIDDLDCGGSTNLDKGIVMAYEVAKRNFRTGGVNSIILCSDGMANVGPQDAKSLVKTAESYRKQGIAFNSVGFGMGNYNDNVLETMANKGDGSYVFIDNEKTAVKFFTEELGNRLNVIAKDAKIQVKFDPNRVRRYRLLGYENRDIKDKDFRNDSVDAGEVGSGQSATALYEVELIEGNHDLMRKDLGTVFVRYRNAETEEIEEINSRLRADSVRNRTVSDDPRFFLAAAVAEYAEIMRQSEYAKDGSLGAVERMVAEVAMQLRLDAKVKDLLTLVRSSKGLPRGR